MLTDARKDTNQKSEVIECLLSRGNIEVLLQASCSLQCLQVRIGLMAAILPKARKRRVVTKRESGAADTILK